MRCENKIIGFSCMMRMESQYLRTRSVHGNGEFGSGGNMNTRKKGDGLGILQGEKRGKLSHGVWDAGGSGCSPGVAVVPAHPRECPGGFGMGQEQLPHHSLLSPQRQWEVGIVDVHPGLCGDDVPGCGAGIGPCCSPRRSFQSPARRGIGSRARPARDWICT